jgi:hypothetical protein
MATTAGGIGALAIAAALTAGCGGPAVLTRLVEARDRAAELHVQFTKAVDASDRAVMADTDEGALAAANESRQATEAAQGELDRLRALVESLGYSDEQGILAALRLRLDEYRTMDAELLPLAVENSNVRAQRLSFGPAADAANAFRQSLAAAAQGAKERCCIEAMSLRATVAVLEIQVLHAPHIAEASDEAMDRLEARMAAAESVARRSLQELTSALPAQQAHLREATAALERFSGIHRELVTLSRRNSDVRSLALALGRKRQVAASCEEHIVALKAALSKHEFTATR